MDTGYEIAQKRIATEADLQTGFLDLGRLGLRSLPPELFDLVGLRGLCLGRNHRRGEEVVDAESDLAVNDGQALLPSLARFADAGSPKELWLDGIGINVDALEVLKAFNSLELLDICGNSIAHLGPLAGLEALTTLDCSRTQVVDLGPLAGLEALTTLTCSYTQVVDLGPLAGLEALTTLNCSGTQVVDLGPLAGLEALTTLN